MSFITFGHLKNEARSAQHMGKENCGCTDKYLAPRSEVGFTPEFGSGLGTGAGIAVGILGVGLIVALLRGGR